MRLAQLTLTNVRTFRRLHLELGPGVHVIYGENGSGKTNLLEAIALLATARSPRSAHDGDLISWQALLDEPLPAAQLGGVVLAGDERTTVEITVMARQLQPSSDALRQAPVAARRFRVNGIARRASDLIGRLRAVMFSADDLAIIEGPPSGRRRFLDVTISQLEPAYVRALQRYSRVLVQRNSLLRRFQERRADPAELDFWDQELATAGAVIVHSRSSLLTRLHELAGESYRDLSPRAGEVGVTYRPALPGELTAGTCAPDLEGQLLAALRDSRAADIRRGMTQLGPHRDDVELLLEGHGAGAFASRGEQRTLALALRLGEVALSRERTGEAPVLLLDDILSELDSRRRQRVIAAAYGVDQVLITTPDEDRPAPLELPGAARYRIEDGEIVRTS